MYTVDNDWTLEQVDWKQVGIMAFGFLNGITGTAYHSTEPTPKSAFLQLLVKCGTYSPSLWGCWDPAEDTITTVH